MAIVKFEPPEGDVDAFGAMAIVPLMRRWGIVCVSVLALAACSGGDDDASSTTAVVSADTTVAAPVDTTSPDPTTAPTEVPQSSLAPTTEPPATTAAPDATQPPATTAAPSTSAPATTAATDPSVDEAVRLQVEAVEQPKIARAAALRLFEDPFNDELLAELGNFYTGRLLEGLTNVVQEFRDGNFRSVPRDGQSEVYEPDPRSLAVDLGAGRATVQVCHINTELIVETAGNPDGSDRIAADEITERIVELDLELIDDVWMVASATAPETEIATCP